MLSKEANVRLTQVAAGTPAGELLRRYWQPLCGTAELTPEAPKMRITILSEDVVVYRGEDGTYGCVAEKCTHRGCSLYYGFIEDGAIRCAYHGWKYAADGRVLEQPFEPDGSTYKDRVRQQAYPVEELGGLLFAYMGPQPAPLLPRWDVLVRQDGNRRIVMQDTLRCNWLQAQENTADTIHTYYLHGHMAKVQGRDTDATNFYFRPIVRYEFSYCEWGIDKTCWYAGDPPEEEVRPPLIFPNILRIPAGSEETLHWRVPIDERQTRIFLMWFTPHEPGVMAPPQTAVPVVYLKPDRDASGEHIVETILQQDRMAWETQGEIFDRSEEHLGASDEGIIMFRKLLDEQITVVENGGEPLALVRDPEKNRIIEFASSYNRLEKAGAAG